jgi:hypothetical protein
MHGIECKNKAEDKIDKCVFTSGGFNNNQHNTSKK